MKNFKSIVFTAIALGALIFPAGCVTKPAGNQPPPSLPDSAELRLAHAVHDKDLDSAKSWVKQSISVNATKSYAGRWAEPSNWSAAMWSVWNWFEDKPLCAYIMHSDGEFGQKQKDALLEHAARVGDIDRAKVFIELGANPNHTNAFGENCATLALRYFRGQYGIDENSLALPRYGDLEEVNAAVKLNVENEAAAKNHLEEIQKVVDDYKKRAETFAKSPQESANAQLKFAKAELETALEFYKKDKGLKPEDSVPANYASAAQVYGELLDGAANELSICEKNLSYVRFVELLKNSGADLRKLLAGKQDNSGKQDKWKGQQDKWTMDAAARRGVYSAFPLVIDGLWDGELALIQLIGRRGDIFSGQLERPDSPITPEFLAALYYTEPESAFAKLGAILGLFNLELETAMNKQEFEGEFGLENEKINWNFSINRKPNFADMLNAMNEGSAKWAEPGRLIGIIDFMIFGQKYLSQINAEVDKKNAKILEKNHAIFSMFEELPLSEELATKWEKRWERREKARYSVYRQTQAKVRASLEKLLAQLRM